MLMCQFRWRLLTVICIWIVLLAFIGSGLWVGGYLESVRWNNNANSTLSHVTGTYIVDDVCGCGKNCRYTCYDGYIDITYYVETSTNSTSTFNQTGIKVYDDYKHREEVLLLLDRNYPINTTIPILYQKGNPGDYDFRFKDDQGWYIAFFFMVALSLLILVIWGPIELLHFCRKRGAELNSHDTEMAVRSNGTNVQEHSSPDDSRLNRHSLGGK